MLPDGIKGLLIQTPLRGVLRLKGMSEIQAKFPAYVEMFLMGMLYREVLNFESNH